MTKIIQFLGKKHGMFIFALIASPTISLLHYLLGCSVVSCIRTFAMVFLLSIASLWDIKAREVDDIFSACLLCFSFSFISLSGIPKLFIGAVFGLLVMLIPALILKKDKLGGADIKMSCALGAYLGPFGLALSLGIAMPLALIYGKIRKDRSIPLIPFISIGAVISNLIME